MLPLSHLIHNTLIYKDHSEITHYKMACQKCIPVCKLASLAVQLSETIRTERYAVSSTVQPKEETQLHKKHGAMNCYCCSVLLQAKDELLYYADKWWYIINIHPLMSSSKTIVSAQTYPCKSNRKKDVTFSDMYHFFRLPCTQNSTVIIATIVNYFKIIPQTCQTG